jgi:acyl carrier protein
MSLDKSTSDTIRALVYDYFSKECDVEPDTLSDTTNIIEDLEGDSLMLLALLEIVRKKYSIGIELKTLGKHLMKKPANSIGEIIRLSQSVVEHGDNIINVEL